MEQIKPDSIIFDMDGTLWDATDTNALCLTEVLNTHGIDLKLTGEDIKKYVGLEATKIYKILFPELSDKKVDQLYQDVIIKTNELLPIMGGQLFPHVQDCLEQLSKKYKLFMLSNCQKGSIKDFMTFSKTTHCFIDYIEFGSNNQPKHINMKALVDKHNLKKPIYVGDTDSDRIQADMAQIPFIFAAWGFGSSTSFLHKFNSMKEFTDHYLNI